jgi:hypothetical protein
MSLLLKNSTILIISLIIQIIFWYNTRSIKPEMHIVPDLPGERAIKANSLGDEQSYFRILAFEIQNAGDTFGRFTALKNYDYDKLSKWFYLLDSLDDKSNFVPSIASYYYSQTQNTEDVIYIVKYLDYHASKDLEKKWWWMSQAVYLANHKLKNTELALRLAYKLASTPGKIPMWAREMPAFIHEKRGEKEEAFLIIKDIVDNYKNLSREDLNFMSYFIDERIKKMKEDMK